MPMMRNTVYMYGHRPKSCKELWFLSPYEFFVYWQIEVAECTRDLRHDSGDLPARLTERGMEKQRQKRGGESIELVAGLGYEVKDSRGGLRREWLALPDNEHTREHRHNWVFVRNSRHKDPTFAACPMPRHGSDEVDRNAALMLTYFHPWTLDADEAETTSHPSVIYAKAASRATHLCCIGSMGVSCVRTQNATWITSWPSRGRGLKTWTTSGATRPSATMNCSWANTTSPGWSRHAWVPEGSRLQGDQTLMVRTTQELSLKRRRQRKKRSTLLLAHGRYRHWSVPYMKRKASRSMMLS